MIDGVDMMLTERQELILKLIVEEFVKAAEPVGSRTLSKILDFSSATIRNEMADLEDSGFLEKTHTSSGRIPSEKGYRFYVESIINSTSKDSNEYSMIDEIFSNKTYAREEAVEEVMNVVSQLTNYTTVALGPNGYGSKVNKIELIPLTTNTCVILIVTDDGHVESKNINIPVGVDIKEMVKVMNILNEVLLNCPISQVSEKLHYEISHHKISELLKYRDTIVESFIEAFTKFTQSKYYLSGQTNMLYQPEFHDVSKVRELLSIIEHQEIFKLVDNVPQGLTVRIGKENEILAMKDCSVITIPYRISQDESGSIAIVGPTRMEYKKVIPLIEYIAKNMSKFYNDE